MPREGASSEVEQTEGPSNFKKRGNGVSGNPHPGGSKILAVLQCFPRCCEVSGNLRIPAQVQSIRSVVKSRLLGSLPALGPSRRVDPPSASPPFSNKRRDAKPFQAEMAQQVACGVRKRWTPCQDRVSLAFFGPEENATLSPRICRSFCLSGAQSKSEKGKAQTGDKAMSKAIEPPAALRHERPQADLKNPPSSRARKLKKQGNRERPGTPRMLHRVPPSPLFPVSR